MIDDVVVGSVGKMTVKNWHADVEISVKPDVVVPANAVATVGQTSLLGSMHLALDPPLGQAATGRLKPGATIPLNKSSTYPSTEQTLSSLSAVVNAGGLGQIGDVIHNFNAALSGRQGQVRDLLTRLDTFVGHLRRTARQHRRLDPGTEPVRRHVRRATRRHHRGAEQDPAGAGCADRGAARASPPRWTSSGPSATPPPGWSTTRRPTWSTTCKTSSPTSRALADVGPELDAVWRTPPFPVRPERHRPRHPRRLHQPVPRHRLDEPPAEARAAAGHPLGTGGRRAGPGARRPRVPAVLHATIRSQSRPSRRHRPS